MSNNDNFDDPFADIGDGFDNDDQPLNENFDFDENTDDDLNNSESNISNEVDENGEYTETESEESEPIPSGPVNQNSSGAETKPFIKTPLGMAVGGVCVLVAGVVGLAGVAALSGGDVYEAEHISESMPTQVNNFESEAAVAPLNSGLSMSDVSQPSSSVMMPVESHQQRIQMPSQSAQIAPQINPEFELEIKNSIDRVLSESAEMKKNIAIFGQTVSKLSQLVENNEQESSRIAQELKTLSELVNSRSADTAVKQDSSLTKEKAPRDGRTRLSDLVVIDTTESGAMAVVKKDSSGRVFTLFKGEKLKTAFGAFSIEELLENGELILVGDKYFIDKELIKAPRLPKVPERKEAPAKVAQKPVVKEIEQQKIPEIIRNFTLNAVYDSGNSFGLVDEDGDFKTYNKGETVPGLGVVKGLDSMGNLNIGNSVIRSVY